MIWAWIPAIVMVAFTVGFGLGQELGRRWWFEAGKLDARLEAAERKAGIRREDAPRP